MSTDSPAPPNANASPATTGAARTETPPSPEAPVVDRSDAHLDKFKSRGEAAEPDPDKQR